MASKPTPGDREAIRARLLKVLETYDQGLEDAPWRDRVRALVPAFMLLRNLGCSLDGSKPASGARQRILDYLLAHPRQVVAGDELLVVSGIGEWARRVRELRVENGWRIWTGVTLRELADAEEIEPFDGIDVSSLRPDDYVLVETHADAGAASRWKTANRIRRKKGSVQDKILEFLLANVGEQITGEELRYIANNKTEWARRTRELRTEEGWRLATKYTGAPELPVGVYVLESDRQLPAHDRQISDRVRKKVLRRDAYKCTECGWNHKESDPSDPRHLEAHHVVQHKDKGSNDESNLTTLCNLCHDEVHANS